VVAVSTRDANADALWSAPRLPASGNPQSFGSSLRPHRGTPPRFSDRGIIDETDVAGASAPRGAAKERDMLDPKEQAKGGFRAQIDRRREREEQLAAAASADGTADAPGGTPTQPEQQTAEPAPPTAEPVPPTPGTRQPKRWH
jgi:hypothetical protein